MYANTPFIKLFSTPDIKCEIYSKNQNSSDIETQKWLSSYNVRWQKSVKSFKVYQWPQKCTQNSGHWIN